MLVGAVDVIDQKNAPVAAQRFERSALFQKAHLLDGDLAQRSVGRESHEIGMGSKEQRVLVALVGGPALARTDDFEIVRQAEVVLLDLAGIAEQQRRKTPGERGLAHALGPRK